MRSDTQTISVPAPPSAVLDLLSDATRIPQWAPAFAESVEPEGDHWLATTGSGIQAFRMRVDPEVGVADILHPELDFGAFVRVLPNGAGSEVTFTLFFPPGTGPDAISAQHQVVTAELEVIRSLCTADA